MRIIPTSYKGYFFRSRLEARWAVFFDALNVDWIYEPEGFFLEEGISYLPDFYLPSFDGGTFVEVKPEEFNAEENKKAQRLCVASKKKVWLAIGIPAPRSYNYLQWDTDRDDIIDKHGIPCADVARDENRFYVFPGYEEKDLSIAPENYESLGERFLNAVKAARSARFEHDQRAL